MRHPIAAISLSLALICGPASLTSCSSGPLTQANAASSSKAEIAASSRAALNQLYAANPKARWLGSRAKAVLVFPSIIKGGFMVGAMGGNGALIRRNGAIHDFYQTAGLSYGMQAGVQTYGYALFLMDDSAFASLNNSQGWEVGSAPSLVVLDQGMSASLSTHTLHKSMYAMFFNQQGLMGGLGLQGSKITRINPVY